MSTLESRSAETFIDHNRPHLAYFLNTFWLFSAGHWSELSLDVLNGEIAAHFEGNTQINRGAIGRLQRSLPHLLRGRLAASPESWNADPDLLPCANGLLNIPQRTLTPPEAAHRQARTLAADFDAGPEVACPVWASFLQSTVLAETEFLQEFAGLSLTFDTRHETALWLHGPPGSGKSTFLTGLELILRQRASPLNLAALARAQYRAADFFGRSLLISVEQPVADLAHDHLINALVSGEPIPVRGSGGQPNVTRSAAKWIWALTSLPQVYYAGSGLFRRVRIVNFPHRPEAHRDPSLKSQIAQEAPGLLRWALAGLDRLRARGRFDVPVSVQSSTDHYRQSNDLVAQFLAEVTAAGPEFRIQSSLLFAAFDDWCYDNGYKSQSGNLVAAALERLGFQRRRTHGRFYWIGLQLESSASTPSNRARSKTAAEPKIEKHPSAGSPGSPRPQS